MPSAMNDVICTCLTRVYADHASRTDRLTCKLEHALPIRQSFFKLKRVPHFQTRDDLHTDHTPAYNPIYRLENASLGSLSQKSKAGCRRVLIEGDLGTGKTLVCQRLLHEWAKAMQFFRNVKIDQPCITVAIDSEVEEAAASSRPDPDQTQQEETDPNLDEEVAKDIRRPKREWNLGAIDTSTSSEATGNGDGLSLPEGMSRSKSHDANLSNPKDTKLNKGESSEVKNQTSADGEDKRTTHEQNNRSRKSRFDELKEKNSGNELNATGGDGSSTGKKSVRKGSRSRSSGDAETESKTRKREKGKYDGIPQKYLSLLNIASPGEGSFESPGVAKSRTFREPRRQRPSRLTSNLTDYKAMIYVPCVRLALSELLTRCNNSRVRHYYVATSVLLDLLTLSDVPHHPLSFDAVYHWVLANRDDICIIFDNVDGSEAWERLISDAFHDRDGFGKMIAAATPGRISKRDVDSLFYCYGLSPDYSSRVLLSRLRSEAPTVENRISFLLNSSHTQELLCNPLSLSLLSAYFRSVKDDDNIPEHLSELLEHLIHHAMAHETNTTQKVVDKANKGRRRRFSLLNVCETVAFECLENDTNYFSKQKFPQQFWTRHLCDCRLLHEVHEIANFGSIHERPPSPVLMNPCITPDSDSVHSSASSNFDINMSSDVSSSNQSLASAGDHEKTDPATDASGNSSSGALLQVPSLKSSDNIKKANERPKTLSLEIKKPSISPRPSLSQTSQTSGEIVSFTSRCIRDYLASNRVCRYLQSDRDSEGFVQRLIAKPQFYPVLRLTVRSLYVLERSDLILNLLDMLLTSNEMTSHNPFAVGMPSPPRGPSPVLGPEPRMRIPHRYRVSNSDCPFRAKREEQKQRRSSTSILGTCFEGAQSLRPSPSFNKLLVTSATPTSLSPYPPPAVEETRGYLEDYKEPLIWLAETDNSEPYIGAVCNRFPDTLVISYQDCPSETIEHFICLTRRSSPAVKKVVLYMSGFYTQWDLGLRLAEALLELKNLSVLHISMKCVVETSFLVDFVCECFEKNDHVETLCLEGPMNVAENLSSAEHKRVQRVFRDPRVQMKALVLDHFSYHHRVGYLLDCWPDILEKLQIKKCNIDNVSEKINQKISRCPDLACLTLDNCFVPISTLLNIVRHVRDHAHSLKLTTLEFTFLSSARKFNKGDVKKSVFKSAISPEVCETLASVVQTSTTIKHLLLSYNSLTDDKARVLLHATMQAPSLVTLDLTGNLITNDVEDDVILLLNKATQLTSLLLGDNGICKQTRSAIIRESLTRHDLRLSL